LFNHWVWENFLWDSGKGVKSTVLGEENPRSQDFFDVEGVLVAVEKKQGNEASWNEGERSTAGEPNQKCCQVCGGKREHTLNWHQPRIMRETISIPMDKRLANERNLKGDLSHSNCAFCQKTIITEEQACCCRVGEVPENKVGVQKSNAW